MLKKIQFFFLLALLVHLLFLLSFSLTLNYHPIPEKKPENVIPAYVYREVKNNPVSNPLLPPADKSEKNTPTSPFALEKQKTKSHRSTQPASETLSIGKGDQNINLHLKATDSIDKPLLKLLTKATASHLTYPKIAYDFHTTGTVTVGFVLSPEGRVSNTTVLKSSGSDILDNAAVAAINAISPVKGVNVYLKESKPIVVGIIFG